jgi:hypothetical protein
MPQFKEAHPAFYNAYFAARVVPSQRGKGRAGAEAATTTPTVTPVSKAA